MQKQLSILATLLLLVNVTHAAILRCNNNPLAAGPNVYSTAQFAHDAASPGDTIHLEPTTFGNYGTLNMTKKLTVISTGYWVNENPNNQASDKHGTCDDIYLYPGSEFSTISAVSGGIFIATDNISILNSFCNHSTYLSGSISNIVIAKSFITSGIIHINGGMITGLTIKNNILRGINTASVNSAVIVNNTFLYNSNQVANYVENAIFSNNVITYTNYSFYFANCVVSDNICENTMLPSGNGNLNNVDFSTVFATQTADLFQLLPTYPNQNLGAFASNDPYRSAVQPAIPAIYKLQNSGLNNGNNLQIQVSTKSNN